MVTLAYRGVSALDNREELIEFYLLAAVLIDHRNDLGHLLAILDET